jgi:hypothetical protein
MLTLIVILKALTEVAGLALLGQGVLFLLAGSGREQNVFYRTLKTITSPVVRFTRLITPRFVADRHIGMAAFFLVAGVWLALGIEKLQLCRETPSHPACAALREMPGFQPAERARPSGRQPDAPSPPAPHPGSGAAPSGDRSGAGVR